MSSPYVIVAVFAALYIGGPLLVKRLMNINARAPLAPVAHEALPAEALVLFEQTSRVLRNLGFELVSHFEQRGVMGPATPVVSLWVNRATGQAAAGTVIYTRAPGPGVKNQRYLEFSTKMADGMAVMTSDSAQLGSFEKVPTSDSLHWSYLRGDVRRLYRLHCYRERILTDRNGIRYLPAPGHELESFREGLEYTLRRQVHTDLYLDAGDGVYRPSLWGAFAMTWALLPPFKQMRYARRWMRARAQLRAAEENPVAPPANVQISHESPYLDDPALTGI